MFYLDISDHASTFFPSLVNDVPLRHLDPTNMSGFELSQEAYVFSSAVYHKVLEFLGQLNPREWKRMTVFMPDLHEAMMVVDMLKKTSVCNLYMDPDETVISEFPGRPEVSVYALNMFRCHNPRPGEVNVLAAQRLIPIAREFIWPLWGSKKRGEWWWARSARTPGAEVVWTPLDRQHKLSLLKSAEKL